MECLGIDKKSTDTISSTTLITSNTKEKTIITKKRIISQHSQSIESTASVEIIDENDSKSVIDVLGKNKTKKKTIKKNVNSNQNQKTELIVSIDDGSISEKLLKNIESDQAKMKSHQRNVDKIETVENSAVTKIKKQSKKSKAIEKLKGKENISMDPSAVLDSKCKSCNKIVYKMEEIKAENFAWHKTCFKCHECGKQLNVDTYQSHESILYCKPHLKLLFAPKTAFDDENDQQKSDLKKKRKPELIIRENQPAELPPDVIRSSDTPNLGLEELQKLNVRAKFQVFEEYEQKKCQQQNLLEKPDNSVQRSTSILSKMAKFNGNGLNDENLDGGFLENPDFENEEDGSLDPDLITSKYGQREQPIRFDQMNDIKTKFESGCLVSREERREERKQEIQNIRSRLFMGKQARIKEQYQQAVAESEQAVTSVGKKCEIDMSNKATSLKKKFETGELFDEQRCEDGSSIQRKMEDEEIFESGIGKQSRSLFMELDASTSKLPLQQQLSYSNSSVKENSNNNLNKKNKILSALNQEVVKCDEENNDIKIETSQITSKFKFFENYKPEEQICKKPFRITPPREDVVKMPSEENDENETKVSSEPDELVKILVEQHTASKMLSRFRELEQAEKKQTEHVGYKPLKCFTPPPDSNKRMYENESDEDYEEEDEDYEEEETSDAECQIQRYDDEYLKIAQQAARANQLRAKFEKWETNEIRREQSGTCIDIYDNSTDESQIESAKSLRDKFESMKSSSNSLRSQPKVQVNRFV